MIKPNADDKRYFCPAVSGKGFPDTTNADQLTSWPGMHSYTYWPDGSLKEVKTPTGTVIASYTYTKAGLLDTATYNDRTLANTWDADGNRVKLNANGSEYKFVYDITAGVPAVLEEITPTGTVYYLRGPGGNLIARQQGETRHYYHFDELGSTRLLTDNTGAVTDTYAYDAYGAVIAHDRKAGSIDQPYQYVGECGYYTHYQEPSFGLVQLGLRFYDPDTGRFTQLDPIGDGINWYAYADGNPMWAVDPWGLAVGSPGFGESLIPIWGSGREAINDFQTGNYIGGTINTALAISDVFLVKAAITSIGKFGVRGLWKSGSHTWSASRKFFLKTGFAEPWVPLHHWLIRQGSWLGKRFPALINQPWNLISMDQKLHVALHAGRLKPFQVLLYGTPKWFKRSIASYGGRFIEGLFDRGDCQ